MDRLLGETGADSSAVFNALQGPGEGIPELACLLSLHDVRPAGVGLRQVLLSMRETEKDTKQAVDRLGFYFPSRNGELKRLFSMTTPVLRKLRKSRDK